MISILVAADPNGVIGQDNKIPWYLTEDLKLFKQRTTGHSIIMGRLTWESLPYKPLPGRVNYVISRNPVHPTGHRSIEDSLAGPIWCKSLEEALADAGKNLRECGRQKEIFIVGGEQIYKLALEMGVVERIILTSIKKCYDGDRYFIVSPEWKLAEVENHNDFQVLYYLKS